jgi:Rieske Fe-S protein
MVRGPAAPYRDRVDETPDYIPRTKPRSTFRVIGTLLLAALVGGFVFVQCVRLYADSAPRRTLEIRRTELEVDVPKLYALPSLGADGTQTHGVWITLRADGTALAVLSRDPRNECFVAFRASLTVDDHTGVYRDRCHGSTYDREGRRFFGPSPRDLDRYRVRVTSTAVIVELEDLIVAPTSTASANADATPTRVR